jgi:signal transduction histidine kinase/CheY-like chemotaxis protein/HPt (histidine-containing phosphotransfer) domain-containing protein
MNKKNNPEGVKGKVVAGFLVILFLALAAVFAVIHLATQLSPPDTGVSQSVTKLTLVSNMLSKLIDADGQARAYITTGQRRYLKKYREDEREIRAIADSLKYTSVMHTDQYLRMLVVDSLLDLKKATLENFFRQGKTADSPILSAERLNQVLQRFNDTVAFSTRTIAQPATTPATKTKENETAKKENIFKRLWSGIAGKSPAADSIPVIQHMPGQTPDTIQTFTRLHDSTVARVRTQLEQMEEEERIERQMTIERELMLLKTDQVILDEIRNVLILFEKEEINRAIEGSEKANALVKRLWNTAIILGMAGLLTMLIFVILIWKDLARSAFYRRQLEKARLLAEKLLKVKEMFLANMSHEIRTPITSIIGFSERLSGTRLSEEQQNYLKYINSSSEHLLGLIDDLLDYSRIGSGKLILESHPLIPADLLGEVFETLRSKAEDKGIEMHYTATGEIEKAVNGDPLRIRQIIYNLLNNSIKFTERGSISLEFEAHQENEMLAMLIRVTDTGIGIPEEKQQEIFEEFTQVDEGITRKYGGSGLGLAICRKLTGMMNGTIGLQSSPGKGTTVEIRLQLPGYQGEITPQFPEALSGVPVLKEKGILLAEDDETTRLLITGLLHETGARVDAVPDGMQAWDLYLQTPHAYDLVMTDIQMPLLSGPDLIANILSHARENGYAAPPFIGLTAHATPDDFNFYRSQGLEQFLIKPFRQAAFYQAVARALGYHSPEGSEVPPEPTLSGRELNLAIFNDFSGNDPEALKKILESLMNNINETARLMEEALRNKEYKNLALLAHRLLPNIRNLGASTEAGLLKQLETAGRLETPSQEVIMPLLRQVVEGLNEIEGALKEKLQDY